MTRGRAALGALATAVVLAGCGVGEDRDQAQQVVERFYAAVEQGDGAAACAQLSRPAADQLESQSGRSCDRAVTELAVAPGPVVATHVFVTNARVELATGDSAFLSREPAGWRLSAVACSPEQGTPRDRPLECEVEA